MTPHQRFITRLARLEPLAFEARKAKAAEFGSGPVAEEDFARFLRGVAEELSAHPDAKKRARVPAIALAAVRSAIKAV